MYKYKLTLFTLLGLAIVNQVHSQVGFSVIVKPSKLILRPDDTSVELTCSSQGTIPENPYNVVVFTAQNTVIYNSSNPNQLAAHMKVANHSSIIVYDVQNGVSDINCRINNTFTKISTTIPHINSVNLWHSDFRANDSTTIKCSASIIPNVTDLAISLNVNGTEVGRYSTTQFQVSTFSLPTVLPNLRVEQGNETYSYTIIPGPNFDSGIFTCSVTVRVSTESETIISEKWNTSGSGSSMAAFTLLLITVLLSLAYNNFW